MPTDLRTKAIVLRRTNYGESDRILNLLTPTGKVSALARSVRKEKSRLAGGVELFSLTEVVVHQGRSPLGTLTGAKTIQFFQHIITDMERLELASTCLRRIDLAADQVDNPEHFALLEQILSALNRQTSVDLVATWFWLNFAQISGEEVNLYNDIAGETLDPAKRYFWDHLELALRPHPQGDIGVREIKLARLLLNRSIEYVAKVEGYAENLPPLLQLGRSLNRVKS